MTRNEAIAIIKRGLGFLQGTTHDEAIAHALVQAQAAREGSRSLPWFLLKEDQTLSLPAGTSNVSLPTDFIREDVDHSPVTLTGEDGVTFPLDPLAYDEAIRLYEQDAQGAPEVYAIRRAGTDELSASQSIWLFPTTDAAYTLTYSYYAAAEVLNTTAGSDSDTSNLWLTHAPYVLISDAGLQMATDLRDESAAAIYSSRKAEWDAWYTREMTARLEANTRYVVGRYA